MENLTVRKAVPSDADKIAELRLLGQEHFEKLNASIWRMTEEGKKLLKQKVENDLADSSIRILLAEKDHEIIGYVQGEVASRDDYLPRAVGHISLTYVVKQFRRKGVGRRLVRELLRFFGSNKVENLTVRYIIGNEEAEEFWRKLGFEPIMTTGSTQLGELDFKLKEIIN